MERKLAAVLFVDLVGSTSLVTGSDPEVVRRRVTRFFDQVARCIETHGGTVEKFAGDAVLAAFGIPRAHEDDAERAIRAALAIREEVHELGLEARLGIESGEVVTDEADSTFATGEAVNIAARLQQAAAPGEILIGPGAHGLTAGRIEVEELGPVQLRGLDRSLWAWRVLGAPDLGTFQRTVGTAPFVGRSFELQLLENTWDRTVRDRRAYLVTVYGDPGVGKSRLAREFTEGLEGATVLMGRALPYGEGITYWPFAEMVKTAAGISDDDPVPEAVEKLRVCCEDEAVADLLALASGVLEALQGDRGQQEIAWAAREFVEQLASAQPLVLLFEDIHWAEEPLLELIEHLAAWVREAPLLILALARPELLDVRPSWGGGNLRASALELTALAPDESMELVHALLDDEPLTPELRETLLEKTEGNPLFLEETVRVVAECGVEGALAGIPDSLHALIASRIDRLPHAEKGLLQRASVIGRIFWQGAMEYVAADGTDSEAPLDDLLLRDLVLREPRSTITGERAYRFKHVLIREVAYSGLSKSARAGYHERFAGWLKERAGDELLEIRAYHLDQAATLLGELDGEPPVALASEAAAALQAAGKRALAREANRAARTLLLRSVELEPTLERRYLAARAAWRMTDYPAVAAEMELVRHAAHDAGDSFFEGRALTALAEVATYRDADPARARKVAEEALQVLPHDYPEARFDALQALEAGSWWIGDLTTAEEIVEQALEIALRADRADLEARAVHSLASNYLERLQHEKALPMIERAFELAEASGSTVQRAYARRSRGNIHLMRGELDEAEELYAEARDLFEEAGAEIHRARTLVCLADVAAQKDDLRRAEKVLRKSISILKPLADRSTLCEAQRHLAQVLVKVGKLEEAEIVALEARQTVGPLDHASRATTRMALATVRAAQGRDAEAEALFQEALEVLEGTDFLLTAVEPLTAFVQFLRERGRDADAAAHARRLLELAPARALASAFETTAARL